MRTALTGYLKPEESEENRGNSNDPPTHTTTTQWYRYNRCCHTSINRWENFLTVTTLRATIMHLLCARQNLSRHYCSAFCVPSTSHYQLTFRKKNTFWFRFLTFVNRFGIFHVRIATHLRIKFFPHPYFLQVTLSLQSQRKKRSVTTRCYH